MVMVVVWSVDKEDGWMVMVVGVWSLHTLEGLFEPATDRRLTVAAAPTTVTSPGNVASPKKLKTLALYVLFEKISSEMREASHYTLST